MFRKLRAAHRMVRKLPTAEAQRGRHVCDPGSVLCGRPALLNHSVTLLNTIFVTFKHKQLAVFSLLANHSYYLLLFLILFMINHKLQNTLINLWDAKYVFSGYVCNAFNYRWNMDFETAVVPLSAIERITQVCQSPGNRPEFRFGHRQRASIYIEGIQHLEVNQRFLIDFHSLPFYDFCTMNSIINLSLIAHNKKNCMQFLQCSLPGLLLG